MNDLRDQAERAWELLAAENGRISIGSDVVIGGRKAKVIGLDPYTPCLEIEWTDAAGGKEYRPREQMTLASRKQGMRAQFEAWAKSKGLNTYREHGYYYYPQTVGAWGAWRDLAASSTEVRRMQIRNTDMGVELRKRAEAINRLTDELERIKAATDLKRFRKLASWVANCAGHGINDAQRRMGEELLALIDSKK